jgi:hypothetical protein
MPHKSNHSYTSKKERREAKIVIAIGLAMAAVGIGLILFACLR